MNKNIKNVDCERLKEYYLIITDLIVFILDCPLLSDSSKLFYIKLVICGDLYDFLYK